MKLTKEQMMNIAKDGEFFDKFELNTNLIQKEIKTTISDKHLLLYVLMNFFTSGGNIYTMISKEVNKTADDLQNLIYKSSLEDIKHNKVPYMEIIDKNKLFNVKSKFVEIFKDFIIKYYNELVNDLFITPNMEPATLANLDELERLKYSNQHIDLEKSCNMLIDAAYELYNAGYITKK